MTDHFATTMAVIFDDIKRTAKNDIGPDNGHMFFFNPYLSNIITG